MTPSGPVVEFCGSIYAQSGYGEAARRYVAAMVAAGLRVRVSPFNWGDFDDEAAKRAGLLAPLVGRDYGEAPAVRIVHQNPAFGKDIAERLHGPFAGPWVLLTVWETDRLPVRSVKTAFGERRILDAISSFDFVWVPTGWNRDVFLSSGVAKPVEVFGHPFDLAAYEVGEEEEKEGEVNEKFTFYWMGAWVERKNPLGILRAFLHAFGPNDDVRLVLKTGGVSEAGVRAEVEAVTESMNLGEGTPEVLLAVDTWPDEKVREMHLCGDCYVSLARGEGWDLPLYDAALFGRKIIYSDIEGHRWAHSIPKHSGGIALTQPQPALGDPNSSLYNGKMLWQDPNLADAAEAMQEATVLCEEIESEQRRRENAELLSRFALSAVGAEMRKSIEAILGR